MKVRSQEYLVAFGNNLKILIANKKKTPEDTAALGNIETKQGVVRVLLYSFPEGVFKWITIPN